MLTDLLFADNPWWLGKEVPLPERLLPFSDLPGTYRFWVPPGGISVRDLKGMAYGWTKRWGQYSAFLIDLSRVEIPISEFENALDFYLSRLHVASERHLLIINAAQWVEETVLREFLDESYTTLLIYGVKPRGKHRVILPYYPDSPSTGEVREAFWSGNVARAKEILSGYGRTFMRKVKSYFWKYVVGFPPDERMYESILKMYAIVHEYYDVREKEMFRKVLSYLVGNAGGRIKFREAAESIGVRFETFRAFMDQLISVGLIYEFYHVNRESPRAPRIVLLANGHFHHLLKHTDQRDILMLDEGSDDVLPFLLPYVIGKAMERGVSVMFEDEGGKHLYFDTEEPFTVRLGEEVSPIEIVGML